MKEQDPNKVAQVSAEQTTREAQDLEPSSLDRSISVTR